MSLCEKHDRLRFEQTVLLARRLCRSTPLSKTVLVFLTVFLVSCSSTVDEFPTELPRSDSSIFETINKSKEDLLTPTGTKQIYDPLQDSEVKSAFNGLVQARRRAGYFKELPNSISKRWQTDLPKEGFKLTWDRYRKNHSVIDDYLTVLRLARSAQFNDYRRAGCASIESKICYAHSFPQYDFGPCSEKQTNWGGHMKSKCEMATNIDHDTILTFARRINRSKNPDDFCVNPTHIGDPKRGAVDNQFEDYFSMSCVEYKQ